MPESRTQRPVAGQIHYADFELRTLANDQTGLIEGYASRFNELDAYGDLVQPGAFSASLAQHRANGSMPAMLWLHQAPAGVWDTIEERAAGLYVEGHFALDTQIGQQAYAHVKAGTTTGLSIGFSYLDIDTGPAGTWIVNAVDLHEVSLTPTPAAPRARLTSVRHIGEKTMPETTPAPDAPANPNPAPEVRTLPAPAVTQEAFDALQTELRELRNRADAFEIRAQRLGSLGRAEDDEQRRAFTHYLRTGDASEVRTLVSANASQGGVLVPSIQQNTIIQRVVEFSPIRGLAQVITMPGGDIDLPRLEDEVAVGPDAVGEISQRAEGTATFSELTLSAYEMAVSVPISRILIEDAGVDISAFILSHVARKFGQREAAWFMVGTGIRMPVGIINDTEVTVADAGGSSLDADDVIDLYHAIPSAYAMNGVFLANRKTMATLRKLKDDDGQYLFQPALAASTPPTLHGRPLIEAPELPDPTTGNTPLVFGDFASGYLIGDRVGVEVVRDDVTLWDTGKVKFGFRRRVGGRVILGEAIAKLQLQ